jgi:drug/metabolite transporter (DMT)-like permease
MILVGAGDVVANSLYAVATTGALLAVVAVLGYLFPVVTVVLAHIFLRERLTRLQQLGAGAALAGALLMVV